MDNDNKIIIQKPEVELFLQDDIYAFNREKPKMYDLEKEFANVKKQKKHTILWPLIILFIISVLLTLGITYYIRYQNRQISVNVDVFEDINLRKLLDMVSKIEDQIEDTKDQKINVEKQRTLELDSLAAEKEAELITVESLPISAKEKESRRAEIEARYENTIAEITTKYDNEIALLDLTLTDLQDQLNAYDSANIERAQQQQAAIDSQRQLFEIEKQQLTESYETTINDLQTQLSALQSEENSMRVRITEEIAGQYQAQYAALEKNYNDQLAALDARLRELDPTVEDEKYVEILKRANIVQPQPEVVEDASTVFDSEQVETVEGLLEGENPENPTEVENPAEVIAENPTEMPLENAEVVSLVEEIPSKEVLSLQQRLETINDIPDSLKEPYENLLVLSSDYEMATELLLSVPQENDIPQYVLALEKINAETNNQLLDLYFQLSEEYSQSQEEYSDEKTTLKQEKTSLQNQLYREQNKNLELKENNATLNKIYSYFERQALENGDAGYVLDVSDKEKLLVYVSPLYKNEINYTLAYVFRKSDEMIGTITLIKEGDFYYGIPSTTDVGQSIKPGDKILLDVIK
ncbi:MAG: hypothetical protein J5978_02740 [Spirochaetaceae bacterium]|nr:hypothetical protein [Spirochaetaceae bacterium]